MEDEETLQKIIIVETTAAISSINSLKSTLEDVKKSISTLTDNFKNFSSSIDNSVDKTNEKLKKMDTTVQSSSDKILNMGKGFSVVSNALKGFIGYKTISNVKKFSAEGAGMVETNNLFANSMGIVTKQIGEGANAYYEIDREASTYYSRALDYQDEMYDKTHLNTTAMKQFQGSFFAMLKNQGVDLENAYKMSESLTNAAMDLSSLHNVDFSQEAKYLQSGLAGEVRSLRTQGIDVSESALQSTLDSLGIDRKVEQLSYAEKEVARYIAVIRQAGWAQGDFANSFYSTANQTKLLQDEMLTLRQVWGITINSLMGGADGLLVKLRAVMMVIEDIIVMLGSWLGVDYKDTGISSLVNNIDYGTDSIADNTGKAAKNAKEFKKQLMGFDEINNIAPPTQSNKNSGLGGGSIDPKLLAGLTEWDNKMGDLTDKAKEYRDRLEEALGITRDSNGELHWSWDNMSGIAKIVTVTLGAITAFKLLYKLAQLKDALKKVGSLFKSGDVAEGPSLFQKLATWLGKSKDGTVDLKAGYARLAGVTVGIVGLVDATRRVYEATKQLAEGTEDVTEATRQLKIGYGEAMASGALAGASIGAHFGGTGALIGGITGALAGLTTELITQKNTYDRVTEEMQKRTEEAVKSIRDELNSISSNYTGQIDYFKTSVGIYRDQLEGIIDSNGRIKKGYEEVADTILGKLSAATGDQYTRSGNQIAINGKIIDSYNQIVEAINKTIDAKEDELRQAENNAILEEIYKKRANLQIEYVNASEQRKKEIDAILDALADKEEETTRKINDDIVIKGNAISSELVKNRQVTGESLSKILESNTANWEDTYNSLDEASKGFMLSSSTTAENLKNVNSEATQKLIGYWNDFLATSPQKFMEAMSSMDSDTSAKLFNVLSSTDEFKNRMINDFIETANTVGQQSEIAGGGISNLNTNFENFMKSLSGEQQATIAKMISDMGEQYTPAYAQAIRTMTGEGLAAYTKGLGDLSSVTETQGNILVNNWIALFNKMSYDGNTKGFFDLLDSMDKETADTLRAMLLSNETLGPKIAQAYGDIGKNSKAELKKYIDKMPDDQKKVILAYSANLEKAQKENTNFFNTQGAWVVNRFAKAGAGILSIVKANDSDLDKTIDDDYKRIQENMNGASDRYLAIWDSLGSDVKNSWGVSLNDLSSVTNDKTSEIITSFRNKKPQFSSAGAENADAVVTTMTATLQTRQNEAPMVIDTMANNMSNKKSLFSTIASNLGSAFNGGLSAQMNLSQSSMNSVFDGVANAASNSSWKMYNAGIDNGWELYQGYWKQTKDRYSWGYDFITGFANGMQSRRSWLGSIASGVISVVKGIFHFSRPDEGPMREYEKWAPDFIQGFAKGLEDNKDVLKNKAISVANVVTDVFTGKNSIVDTKYDATANINYGELKGQISTSMNSSSLPRAVADAVYNAMRQSRVNVQIEARTDKGTVVKTVTEGIQEYVNQTGQLPFEVPT